MNVLLALAAGGAVSVAFGFLWHLPFVFGSQWLSLMGWTEATHPKPSVVRMTLSIIGEFLIGALTSLALWFFFVVAAVPTLQFAIVLAVYLWVGFILTTLVSSAIWERTPWELFVINALFRLISLMLIAVVLSVILI